MFEFLGEGLILDGSLRIHWLIWIQLLVLVFLLLLLYSLSSSNSDAVILTPSVDAPLSSTTAAAAASSSSFRRRQIQKQKKKLPEEDSNPDRWKDGVEIEREGDGSALTEVTHPCHIVRLARMVFLKCFGLLGGPPKGQPHL